MLREFKQKYERAQEKNETTAGSSGTSAEIEAEHDLTSIFPSTVGISANMASNLHMFVGDYFYQRSRKEELDVAQLQERIVWILKNVEKTDLLTNGPNTFSFSVTVYQKANSAW